MSRAEIIMQYCREANSPVTAMQIVDACFPGKEQPYVSDVIRGLVNDQKLVRNDQVRPFTVHLPSVSEDIVEPVATFSEAELEETAQRVSGDPRYGEEGEIISNCLCKFPNNDDDDVIAMKIALVDMTNSTNLNKHLGKVHLTGLIEKIRGCSFDERVAAGDVTLVSELARNEINLFSFFSKYCLYHNYYVYQRDDFVIFDGIMQNHAGKYVSSHTYMGRTYRGAQLHNCIEKMRQNYDYEGYLALIDAILDSNGIQCKGKRRMFDWFVWYNNRK